MTGALLAAFYLPQGGNHRRNLSLINNYNILNSGFAMLQTSKRLFGRSLKKHYQLQTQPSAKLSARAPWS